MSDVKLPPYEVNNLKITAITDEEVRKEEHLRKRIKSFFVSRENAVAKAKATYDATVEMWDEDEAQIKAGNYKCLRDFVKCIDEYGDHYVGGRH